LSAATQSTSDQIVLDPQHPWPSLHAFTQNHQAYFRGRDAEIEELVQRLRRHVLTILFSISGLGKTSLLQAGLFPALTRTEFVPVLVRLDPKAEDIDLVQQVEEEIRKTIGAANIRARRFPKSGESLWAFFHQPELWWSSPLGQPLTAVLVFDQFEEIFIRSHKSARSTENQGQLLDELAWLVENRPPQDVREEIDQDPDAVTRYDFSTQKYRVVISFREDYLAQFEELRKQIPSIMENRLRITRMSERQALEAILGPGREVIEEPVAREVIRFIAGASNGGSDHGSQEVDPALLSLMCSELNIERIKDRLPLITSDLLKGQSKQILDQFYSRCFEFLPENKQEVAKALIEDRLLTKTEPKYRDSVVVEELENELAENSLPSDMLERLVKNRLLQFDDRRGLQRIELAHDILTKVVGDQRDKRLQLQKVQEQRRRDQQEREAAAERAKAAAIEIHRLRKARTAGIVIGGIFGLILTGITLFYAILARESAIRASELQSRNQALRMDLTKKEAVEARKKTLQLQAQSEQLQAQSEQLKAQFERQAIPALQLLARIQNKGLVRGDPGLDREIQALLGTKTVSDTASVERNRARELDREGDAARQAQNWDDALRKYNESRSLREQLAAKSDTPDLQYDISTSWNNLGNLYFDEGNFSEALNAFDQALQKRSAIAEISDDPRWQRGRFFCLLNLSDTLERIPGRMNDAVARAKDALEIANRLANKDANNPVWKSDQKLAKDQIRRLQSNVGK
jgi:tetratricopeptide (TPR) repeat protein